MKRRHVILGLVIVIAIIGWYLFRPELLFINRTVNEKFPATAPTSTGPAKAESVVLSTGAFHGVAHETKGTATIYQLADGKKMLRFTGFRTSNGPDVQVYLVAAPDARDNEAVTRAGFITLGALKGNIGDQNYDLPADVDLTKYRSVSVWCRRFSVNFGAAPLAAPTKGSAVRMRSSIG